MEEQLREETYLLEEAGASPGILDNGSSIAIANHLVLQRVTRPQFAIVNVPAGRVEFFGK